MLLNFPARLALSTHSEMPRNEQLFHPETNTLLPPLPASLPAACFAVCLALTSPLWLVAASYGEEDESYTTQPRRGTSCSCPMQIQVSPSAPYSVPLLVPGSLPATSPEPQPVPSDWHMTCLHPANCYGPAASGLPRHAHTGRGANTP